MILAAGRGERMKPLTDSIPKPLLQVENKALIVYHLEKLASIGVEHVVINIAWLGDKIKQQLGDGLKYGLHISYSDEGDSALETAGGIIKALPLLADKFWVVNADVYTDFTFGALNCDGVLAHLLLVNNPEFHPNGDFGVEGTKLLAHAEEQFTFSGIAYYHKKFFKDLGEGKRALAPIIRQHAATKQVAASVYQGLWSDVGTPQRLAELNASD